MSGKRNISIVALGLVSVVALSIKFDLINKLLSIENKVENKVIIINQPTQSNLSTQISSGDTAPVKRGVEIKSVREPDRKSADPKSQMSAIDSPAISSYPIESSISPSDIPLELQVNILGQRIIGNNDYEEVIIKNGSVLKNNDNFQIYVRTSRECYIYVLIFDSEGKAGLLFPGMAGSDNKITGNRSYQIPSGNKWFYLDEHTGTETIYVLADVNPMTDIGYLLGDMERKGSSQQKEDSQRILTQVAALKRGVGGVTAGKTMSFRMGDGDAINNVTQVVNGRGSLVWFVSFKHI